MALYLASGNRAARSPKEHEEVDQVNDLRYQDKADDSIGVSINLAPTTEEKKPRNPQH